MFQFGDLFRGGFGFLNQQPALEDKLSDQNLPLEDFLKDDEAISTIKFMGKNTKKYLNSEKIKKLIKLITEEPKIDDHLHGHKFPYVAFQILKSDCPFIAKRFVLNEQEYHEEYPESPEDDLDMEIENENKEIDFDFKQNKIEFEKIYAQIEENIRNIRKSIDSEKEEKRSKDDYDKDLNKQENNNYEEEYEEYEEIKEDNVIDDVNQDENNNETNNLENEEQIKNNEIDDIENNNIEEKNNINDENNEEKKDEHVDENKKIESVENKEEQIEEKNKEENHEENNIHIDEKNKEENIEKKDEQIEENNKEEIQEKNDTNENNNDKKEISDNDKTEEINNNDLVQENKENINIEEKNEETNIENNDITKENTENKKEIVENNEISKEIKEEKTEKNKENENIYEEKKDELKNNEENKNESEKEIKDELKEEKINEEITEEIKNENKNETKEEIKSELNNDVKEINEIKEQNEEQKKVEKQEEEKSHEEAKDEQYKENIENSEEKTNTESKDLKNENLNSEESEIKNDTEKSEEKEEKEEKDEKEKEEREENIENEKKEGKKVKEEKDVKEEVNEEKEEKEEVNEEKEEKETKIVKEEKEEVNEEKQETEKKDVKIDNKENEKDSQNIPENNSNIKEELNVQEKKEIKEKDTEINQEEEPNEEMNNIIIDSTDDEKDKQNNSSNDQENGNIDNIDNIDYDQENSLSVEGELDDEIKKKNNKKKKVYKNSENNEYFDLLLNFVMTDKPELNYVLSGYFANVIITLLNTYPYKIIKYLYAKRRDALKKILFHSNQKAFAILSSKLLNIESYMKPSTEQNNEINEFVTENIPYRNELIKEIFNSINLDGLNPNPPSSEKKEENFQKNEGFDIEAIFSLISGLIDENNLIAKELMYNNHLCPHLFDILDTDLYSEVENKENFDENKFNMRYNIYGLFIDLTSKFINIVNSAYSSYIPMDFNFQNLLKPKTDLQFNDNIIISFGKILQNNFLAKKPVFTVEKMSNIKYEGLGSLNLKIFDLVKNMFFFMRVLPKQFDLLLIRNNFCERSVEYFFKYQWNNIYQNKFVDFFNLYLNYEYKHEELTQFYFNHLKLQDLLMDFIEEKPQDNKNNSMTQKMKFEFKNGNKIKSGIYPHVIDLIYKINAHSGIDIFSQDEIKKFKIINLGEFEFSKDEKSNKLLKLLAIKDKLKEIFSKDEKWISIFKSKILPVLKQYEGQLCPKKPFEDDYSDIKNDFGSNNLLLQQMLNVIKRSNPLKRTSLPISRNDKNSSNNSNLSKDKKDKFSIREKLLSKGYKSRHIFDDDDDGDKEEKISEVNYKKNNNEEELDEKDKMFNDSNYWEMKNELPEKVKKEVDKKTNIIFNYNPITGENEKNNEISEEDELLSIAMGLEQNEKMEKNKQIMYMLPGRLKPINLKTKSNPVQNIFININKNKNNKLEKIRNKKKEIINLFENENEEHENEEENVIKKEEETLEENNINKIEENNKEIEDDKDKMFNDVYYWKHKDLVKNEEMEELIKEL